MARYTDVNTAINGAKDFVIRRHGPTLLQLLVVLAAALFLSLLIIVTVEDKLALAGILFVILGSAGGYVVLQIQRNNDLLLATEFQNALFASALGINNKFCLIIRR